MSRHGVKRLSSPSSSSAAQVQRKLPQSDENVWAMFNHETKNLPSSGLRPQPVPMPVVRACFLPVQSADDHGEPQEVSIYLTPMSSLPDRLPLPHHEPMNQTTCVFIVTEYQRSHMWLLLKLWSWYGEYDVVTSNPFTKWKNSASAQQDLWQKHPRYSREAKNEDILLSWLSRSQKGRPRSLWMPR